MTKQQRAYLHIIILPFVISASFEFLPAWLYWPLAVICGMSWLGACVVLAEGKS
jgi:hypothetical protein